MDRHVRRIAGLLSFLLIPARLAQAQVTAADRPADLRTQASASRMVRPNHATFTVQFFAEGSTPRQAGARVAARADSVRRAFMALGVPRDSLVTGSSWYWWPERIQMTTQQRLITMPNARNNSALYPALDTIHHADGSVEYRGIVDTTYQVREIIELRIGDISRIGALIDTALSFGIRQISGIQFASTDLRAAQLSAMREATSRAREQAESIAVASGGKLGRLLYLGTVPDQEDRSYSYYVDGGTVSASFNGGGTQVIAPPVSVTATVYGRWQLLDK